MFAIVGQRSSSLFPLGGATEKITFPPALVHAQVGLSLVGGGSGDSEVWAEADIREYTHRPEPDGVDETVEGSWSVVGAVERMTSITWEVVSGIATYAEGRLDIFWWGDVSASTGGPDPVSPLSAIELTPGLAAVVYDSQAGDIRHVHGEITLPGAGRPDPEGIERRALVHARALAKGELGDVKTLVVQREGLRTRRRMRVDVESRRLVDDD